MTGSSGWLDDLAVAGEQAWAAKGEPVTVTGPGDRAAVRERIDAALQESMDRCARCKACDAQVDAVMKVVAPLIPASDHIPVSPPDLYRLVLLALPVTREDDEFVERMRAASEGGQ